MGQVALHFSMKNMQFSDKLILSCPMRHRVFGLSILFLVTTSSAQVALCQWRAVFRFFLIFKFLQYCNWHRPCPFIPFHVLHLFLFLFVFEFLVTTALTQRYTGVASSLNHRRTGCGIVFQTKE